MRSGTNGQEWKVLPLIEVATLQRGYDLPVQERIAGTVPIFAANGPVGTHHAAMVKGPGVITGRSGTIGRVHFVEQDYWPLNTALFVKDFHGNDPRFVFYLLSSLGLDRYHEGTGVPTLNRNNVHTIPIPLPPLAEQRRIAAILDQADAVRRKRQQALALTDQLAKSIYIEMFGRRDTHRLRWGISTVGKVVSLTNGRAFKSSEWRNAGLPIIRIQNLKSEDAAFNYFDGEYEKQHLVEPGDVLIAWAGQLVSFGVHIWRGTPAVLNQHIFKATPKGRYSLAFLKYALGEVIERAKDQFHGIDMKHITKSDLVNHEIPDPPYDVQSEFERRIENAESIRDRSQLAGASGEHLYQSLVQRAFRGDL